MKKTFQLCAFALALCGAQSASALQMLYTISGNGSGTFAGAVFTKADFKIEMTGDTSLINSAGSVFSLISVSSTVSVTGIGSGTLTNTTAIVANQDFSRAGMSDLGVGRAILFVDNAGFASYDLSTPISLSGETGFNPGSEFPTTAGKFSLTSVPRATFTAVPEPSTALLLMTATGLLISRRRR